MKLAAVETNDRFLGCGAECLSAELQRIFLLHERMPRFQPGRIGLDAVIRLFFSGDRFVALSSRSQPEIRILALNDRFHQQRAFAAVTTNVSVADEVAVRRRAASEC
ncbi:hypothetical protein SuNHUV7_05030 (plasmid) [Pseudoseohaeicola sp. NH-UV-7]|uniref:hypothetical protein n=1 Tax=Sulfitobacter sp. TBRI5 TaxID=2989732 RepID=UPI003A682D24